MSNTTPNTALPLQTISETGQAPKLRVRDASDALTIVQSIIHSGRERARRDSKVKGMLDGNAPYDAVKLKQNAQSYRCNINFGEGGAMLSAGLVPFYDLFAGSQTYAEVRLYLENEDDAVYKSRIATQEFDCLLKKYQGFEFNMNGVFHDYVAFGKGFVMFKHKWGWHFKRVSFNRVFLPDGEEASVEEWEVVVVRERCKVSSLWKNVDNKSAQEVGWKKSAVAQAIRNALPEDRANQSNNTLAYEYIQQMMRDRDLLEGTRLPTVPVAHLLVKEFDGTITHMMVEEQQTPAVNRKGSGEVPPQEFLFKKANQFSNMRQAIASFFFETLDGSANGAQGMGHKIYGPIEIKNRLLCSTVDNAFLSSGITMQCKDATSKQKMALVQNGPVTILPEGYEVLNAQIFSRSDGLVGTNALLDQTISSNTGIYRSKMDKPQGNPRTKAEVEIQYQNATTLSNSGVGRFYDQLDPLYAELYRRVTEEEPLIDDKSEEAEAVREFIRRCKKYGVTREDLKKVESVKAMRNIGNGSQFQRQQSLERFTPYAPMLTEGGREAWMSDLVAAEFGQPAVARYMPDREKQLKPNDQQAMALLENAALKQGAPVAWTPTQNNVIHATEHLKAMSAAAESLQAGAEPMEVLGFMEAAGPHVQIHLQQLQGDPSRQVEFKALSEQANKIAGFTDQLEAMVSDQQADMQAQQEEAAQAAQQAAAIAGGTDHETALATAKLQHEMALKDKKTMHGIATNQMKTNQKLAANDLKLSQSIKHDALKAIAESQKPKQTTDA